MSETLTRVGGVVLCLGAAVIGWVPIRFGSELSTIDGSLLSVGVAFAALVGICGLIAVFRPRHGLIAGAFGILFSVLSLIGALGGFFVGMVLGIVGGILAIVGGALGNADASS